MSPAGVKTIVKIIEGPGDSVTRAKQIISTLCELQTRHNSGEAVDYVADALARAELAEKEAAELRMEVRKLWDDRIWLRLLAVALCRDVMSFAKRVPQVLLTRMDLSRYDYAIYHERNHQNFILAERSAFRRRFGDDPCELPGSKDEAGA
jgi:hypothetical protein